jgi:hypothetical protein
MSQEKKKNCLILEKESSLLYAIPYQGSAKELIVTPKNLCDLLHPAHHHKIQQLYLLMQHCI